MCNYTSYKYHLNKSIAIKNHEHFLLSEDHGDILLYVLKRLE